MFLLHSSSQLYSFEIAHFTLNFSPLFSMFSEPWYLTWYQSLEIMFVDLQEMRQHHVSINILIFSTYFFYLYFYLRIFSQCTHFIIFSWSGLLYTTVESENWRVVAYFAIPSACLQRCHSYSVLVRHPGSDCHTRTAHRVLGWNTFLHNVINCIINI